MTDVIVLEFNELVPSLIDRFIAAGDLPNFARLRRDSLRAVTDAAEPPPYLEPWIQWVTVHTGRPYAEHKVFHLNDGAALRMPRIWDAVSAAGKRAWVCGSMNAAIDDTTVNALVLPDPWATEVPPKPEGRFEPYLDLVQAFVHGYTSGKAKVSPAMVLAFGRFMMRHGLSAASVIATVRQLASERVRGSQWARATILDRLQWDVFKAVYRRERPALSTFFLNSTAHFQHYFWRNMDPQDFTVQSDDVSQRRYADAIRYGYRQMDRIIGDALAMAGPETSIILCTALSQQPMRDYEDIGGKQIFKPHDPHALFDFAGIARGYEYAPVMAEQFFLNFDDADAASDAAARLAALTLDDGTPVMHVELLGAKVFAGCCLVAHPHQHARIVSRENTDTVPFASLFYPVEAVRSGMHHPDGVLWIRRPGGSPGAIERTVQLTELAGTFLALAGIAHDSRFGPPMHEIAAETPAKARVAA